MNMVKVYSWSILSLSNLFQFKLRQSLPVASVVTKSRWIRARMTINKYKDVSSLCNSQQFKDYENILRLESGSQKGHAQEMI